MLSIFRYQSLIEVCHSLKEHKIRTIFTGFGVAWAMLIFVLLQGGGAGYYNGMMKDFRAYGSRSMHIFAGYTATGQVALTEGLADNLAHDLNVFEQIMPIFKDHRSVIYKQEIHESDILGVRIGYEKVKNLDLIEGRFFTKRDLAQELPVCILGSQMKIKLFGKDTAIGEFISIDNIVVCVIGVLEGTANWDDGVIMIPSTFFKTLFPQKAATAHYIASILKPKQNAIKAEKKVRAYLARRLHLGNQDQQALYISSPSKRSNAFQTLFITMQLSIWLISVCFLLSGAVSVGNMMLIVVKERTEELAIRKVIGAGSKDIVSLILLESIIIHFIAGILGMGIGIGIIQWMNSCVVPIIAKHGIANFEFPFPIALSALVVLVLSGCLAGIIPAKRAWHIKPVDALNNE